MCEIGELERIKHGYYYLETTIKIREGFEISVKFHRKNELKIVI